MVSPFHPCPLRGDSRQGGLRGGCFSRYPSSQQDLLGTRGLFDPTFPGAPLPCLLISRKDLADKCMYTHFLFIPRFEGFISLLAEGYPLGHHRNRLGVDPFPPPNQSLSSITNGKVFIQTFQGRHFDHSSQNFSHFP